MIPLLWLSIFAIIISPTRADVTAQWDHRHTFYLTWTVSGTNSNVCVDKKTYIDATYKDLKSYPMIKKTVTTSSCNKRAPTTQFVETISYNGELKTMNQIAAMVKGSPEAGCKAFPSTCAAFVAHKHVVVKVVATIGSPDPPTPTTTTKTTGFPTPQFTIPLTCSTNDCAKLWVSTGVDQQGLRMATLDTGSAVPYISVANQSTIFTPDGYNATLFYGGGNVIPGPIGTSKVFMANTSFNNFQYLAYSGGASLVGFALPGWAQSSLSSGCLVDPIVQPPLKNRSCSQVNTTWQQLSQDLGYTGSSNVFSLWINSSMPAIGLAGKLLLGGVDTKRYATNSTIQWTKVQPNYVRPEWKKGAYVFWTANITKITLSGVNGPVIAKGCNSSVPCTVIFDTGYPFVNMVPAGGSKAVYNQLISNSNCFFSMQVEFFGGSTVALPLLDPNSPTLSPCNSIVPTQFESFTPVTAPGLSNYMVFGLPFLKQFYTIFDVENLRIGLTPAIQAPVLPPLPVTKPSSYVVQVFNNVNNGIPLKTSSVRELSWIARNPYNQQQLQYSNVTIDSGSTVISQSCQPFNCPQSEWGSYWSSALPSSCGTNTFNPASFDDSCTGCTWKFTYEPSGNFVVGIIGAGTLMLQNATGSSAPVVTLARNATFGCAYNGGHSTAQPSNICPIQFPTTPPSIGSGVGCDVGGNGFEAGHGKSPSSIPWQLWQNKVVNAPQFGFCWPNSVSGASLNSCAASPSSYNVYGSKRPNDVVNGQTPVYFTSFLGQAETKSIGKSLGWNAFFTNRMLTRYLVWTNQMTIKYKGKSQSISLTISQGVTHLDSGALSAFTVPQPVWKAWQATLNKALPSINATLKGQLTIANEFQNVCGANTLSWGGTAWAVPKSVGLNVNQIVALFPTFEMQFQGMDTSVPTAPIVARPICSEIGASYTHIGICSMIGFNATGIPTPTWIAAPFYEGRWAQFDFSQTGEFGSGMFAFTSQGFATTGVCNGAYN